MVICLAIVMQVTDALAVPAYGFIPFEWERILPGLRLQIRGNYATKLCCIN